MNWEKIEEKIFLYLMRISAGLILFVLFSILLTIIIKGFSSIDIKMITQTPKGGYYLGKEGGILNAILGSLILTFGATFLSLIISTSVVLYLNVYKNSESKFVRFSRFSFDILCGVPSIVYGAFGFIIMVFIGLRMSLLAGIITVALLIMPIMCRAMDEVIRMIPEELFETSYALGSTRFEAGFKVIIRQAFPGLLTSMLIAMGRGIGDAASILFTAGFSDYIPYSLLKPVATLPLAIFFQLNSPFPEVQNRAYASAFILTMLILLISVLSRFISSKKTKYSIK